MKNLIPSLLLTAFFMSSNVFAGDNNNLEFKFTATYSDGFGVYMKRVFTLKKIARNKMMKVDRPRMIGILVNKKNSRDILLPIDCTDELYAQLMKALEGKDAIKILGVGYETIVASGIPGMGMSVDYDDIILPGGLVWRIRNVFELDSFKLSE